jgi:hypothetical protein
MLRNGDERRYPKFQIGIPVHGARRWPAELSSDGQRQGGRSEMSKLWGSTAIWPTCQFKITGIQLVMEPHRRNFIATVAKCAMVTLRTERDAATKTAWRL